MKFSLIEKEIPSFIKKVTDCLSAQSLDFSEKFQEINIGRQASYLAAGVCMPIYYYASEFHIQLIKRSSTVSQPGDLSFPGGMLNPLQDHFLKYALITGVLPALRNNRYLRFSEKDQATRRLMLLFLANAMREAWEEVRLNPFHVIYLGALPTYTLRIFRRIIFPSVCFIARKSRYQINDEVESLLHIPLSYFFDSSHYSLLRVVDSNGVVARPEDFPCLHFTDKSGQEHILWGATFFVIMKFLKIVYGFELLEIPGDRLMYKTLQPEYRPND
jgi:8-oxo-dGTP pyrophosphatase MutT (NUDIX family)